MTIIIRRRQPKEEILGIEEEKRERETRAKLITRHWRHHPSHHHQPLFLFLSFFKILNFARARARSECVDITRSSPLLLSKSPRQNKNKNKKRFFENSRLDVKNRNTFDKRNESGEKCFPVLAPLLISTGRRRRQKKRKDFQFFYFPFEYKIKTGTDSSRNDVDSSSRQVGKKIK